MWVKPWIQQRDDRGAYTTIKAELYETETDIPGFRKFIRMTRELFEMLKERLAPRLSKQKTDWRVPLSVGLKIDITLRYLATGRPTPHCTISSEVGRPASPSLWP